MTFNEELFLQEMQNTTTCYDVEEKETDIQFEKVSADTEIRLPDYILHDNGKVVNQGNTMLCVAYGTTEGINEELSILGNKGDKNPNVLAGYIRNNLDSNIDKEGTLIENGPKGARKLGWTEAYTYCKTIYDIKKALVLVGPISTGTNKINWSNLKKNNYIAIPGKGGGHFINIVGYNVDSSKAIYTPDGKEFIEYFIIENTWGDKWGHNGRYYIPFEFALDIFFNTKISNIIKAELNRKYAEKILVNIKKEFETKPITPIVPKYEFFDGEQFAIHDKENQGLFLVMQQALKETGYKPIFKTIIGSNEDRTNARLLDVITAARESERNKKG